MKFKLLAALLAIIAMPAHATSLQQMTLDQAVQKAAVIVEAEAISGRTERTDDGVFTYTDFRVQDSVAGDVGGTVTVTTLGGIYQSGKFKIAESWPGSPRFLNGTRAILLLQNSAVGDFEIVGFSQGAMSIKATPSGDVVRSLDGDVMSVSDMKSKILDIRSNGQRPNLAD